MIVVAIAAGAGAYFWREIGGLFTRVDLRLDPAGGGALNVLLIGSDTRDNINDPRDIEMFGRVGGKRADTIILAQIVPSQERGILLHFPRDLWVTIPGEGARRTTRGKINSAYQHGPQAVIDTVQEVTGLPINHYLEIDLKGFRNMVGAIGGVDICLTEPLYDSQLNFRLPEGVTKLNGNQALSFVRARHASPDGDFGRIRRQQQFLKAVVTRVGSAGVLGNPLKVKSLAEAFARNVTVDTFFQLDDMVRFALSVKRVGPEQLQTYQVPGRIGRVGAQSVVVMQPEQADVIFGALRDVVDPKERLSPPTSDAPKPAQPKEPGEPAPKPAGPCDGFG